MQLLVFDAKITEGSYKSSKWAARDRTEYVIIFYSIVIDLKCITIIVTNK